MRALGIAALAALALSGCERELETDQARLCRMATPALAAPGAALTLDGQKEDPDGRGVVVAYRDPRPHEAHCRFQRPGRPAHSRELVELTLDGRRLSDINLFFLIRFWLATPQARAADPAPLGRIDDLPAVSPRVALALQQGVDALAPTAIYALLASAYALIYGMLGRIHLAFGALAAVGGAGAAFGAALFRGAPPGIVLASAGALGVAVAASWGAAAGAVALGPLRQASGQRYLIASVGLSLFLTELLRLTQGTRPNWVPPVLNAPFGVARAGDFVVTTSADALFCGAVALCAGAALAGGLRLSPLGRDWRAYADDPLAAALLGVDPRALWLKTCALGSALAGLAGFITTMLYGAVGYDTAAMLGLKALVAAILGGVGSVTGALLGGVLLGAFEAVWTACFAADYRDAATFLLLAAALAWRPAGLFGAPENSGRRWA